MIWSSLEYVPLRLARRFLFSGPVLDRIGAFMPYWRVNQGRLDPEPIVTGWQRLASQAGLSLQGLRVLELGCGASNGTGYEWTARFGGRWTGLEPYIPFDQALDARVFEGVRWRNPGAVRDGVRRVADAAALESASQDLIVSNSVLEHVRDPEVLFAQCRRLLAPGGVMLHRVDYRDHFFKYPFHFLTFSKPVWNNLLDPGDLPRHRLDDHLAALARQGFEVQVLERETDPAALAAVAPFLAPEFAQRDRDMLATTIASLLCRKVSGSETSDPRPLASGLPAGDP